MADQEDYFYEALPFAETHPDHLGALGVLFGLDPAPPASCRVLEIGAATGGNILPLAAAFPNSTFVAIDRAEDSIAIARRHIAEARLGNILVRLADVRDFEDESESYDYILCHGVYSWVPDDARAAIRKVIRRHLAPHGLAYLSFNTLPGWHLRGAIRDMLRREVGPEGSQAERIARARSVLGFLGTQAEGTDPARAWLGSEISLLAQLSDHYILGEHLVAENRAEYFADFARDMASAGLAFVADAHVPLMFPERLGETALAAIRARGSDVVSVQQSLDYLELRCFRRSILARDDAPIERHVPWDRLERLVVASTLSPAGEAPDLEAGVEEAFHGPKGAIATDQASLKAALVVLARVAPRGLPFDALVAETMKLLGRGAVEREERARLGKNLLGLYTKGTISLWASEKPIAPAASERPIAAAWARFQAQSHSPYCTSLLHTPIVVDTFDRSLLRHMDGSRTEADLVEAALEDAVRGIVSVEMNGAPCQDRDVFTELAGQKLVRLARSGLLVG